MNFQEFKDRVDSTFAGYLLQSNRLRYGQTLMNVLYEVWPEKHKEIIGSDYDCFYDTFIVGHTLSKLEKEWQDD